ncbi:hypothetical protein GMORB2_5404 [Geosmithia morbida]|uniref:Uncharacterized protein n=1 Tax=Geosmithia morbida TaxID=1094350 RepID=A0A9P4YZZ2_9HYPO|nr:uncharacterized protein GMORB2_5404 [Geosmithia morbida]KAF4124738.1 hypothetical protein GMORB2_5404 [Geosmithia morbida]
MPPAYSSPKPLSTTGMVSIKLAEISRSDIVGLTSTSASATITDAVPLASYKWFPDYPLSPLFRSGCISKPDSDIRPVDLVTDRNNMRKLLTFANPNSSNFGHEEFTLQVEIANKTAVFCRDVARMYRVVGPQDFLGYGHAFEKKYTR